MDLGQEKTLKGIMEIGLVKVEAEAPVLKSPVKMQNWVSKVEETESLVRTTDKVNAVTTNSSNQLGKARGTEKLGKVKGGDHSFVGEGD